MASDRPPWTIRAATPADAPWVREELVRGFGATRISSMGVWHEADRLPALVAVDASGRGIGLATHTALVRGGTCEVITLSSRVENAGVGGGLLGACVRAARDAGCGRIFLTTTNDNLRALGFYQKRGWSLVAVHRGAMDRARLVEPSIPVIGKNGIPMRDEIELEMLLGT